MDAMDGGSSACANPTATPQLVEVPETTKPVVLTTTKTQHLADIEVDYGHENLEHNKEAQNIVIKYEEIKEENGARWRTTRRFESGIFSAKIRTPSGNTSGLNCSFYLSSQEGDKTQDEIDFEFLGKDKSSIQTNVYTGGVGAREELHALPFDSSADLHEYTIHWSASEILWFIDGVQVRRFERKQGEAFPSKAMFLYASVWNAGWVNEGKWAGAYNGCDEPYLCVYHDVKVPRQISDL